VLDLQDRIESTCKLAQEEMEKVQGRNKEYFNKRATLRELTEGDKVLVLVPGRNNKLDFQWEGPETIVKRLGVANYRVRNDAGRERIFHINMLKQYVIRDNEGSEKKETADDSESDIEVEISEGENEEAAAVMGVVEDSEDGQDVSDAEMDEIRVSESGKLHLYNVQSNETWIDIQINTELSEVDQAKIFKVVEEYADIFSDVPTATHLIKHEIKLTTVS